MIYGALAAVTTVLIAVVLVWNSGMLQKSKDALRVQDSTYSAGQVQYYYMRARSNEQLMAQYGMSSYNAAIGDKKQVYSEISGSTYHDKFLDEAIENIRTVSAVYQQAVKNGYQDADVKDEVEAQIESMRVESQKYGFVNVESYLKAIGGSMVSLDDFRRVATESLIASKYIDDTEASLSFDEDDLAAFYEEKADDFDTYTLDYITVRATIPAAEKDADGNEIERTDEEKDALLETAKQEKKAIAEQVKQMLLDGAEIEEIEDALEVSSGYDKSATTGTQIETTLQTWAYAADRKPGDVTIEVNEGTTSVTYYIARFVSRNRDEEKTASVRHILVSAGNEPTEAEYLVAKAKAEEILAQWQLDGAKEEDFIALVKEHSADSGSVDNGGLYEGISHASSYVETFQNWVIDPQRAPGDTGIVENTKSSVKGYHIMYFVSWGNPVWMEIANDAIVSAEMEEWIDSIYGDVVGEKLAGISAI